MKSCASKFDGPSSAAAVAEMQRLGLLDDAAFAKARARHLAGQNRSAREIERRLNLLGLCAEDISAAMEEIAPQSEAACRAVVEKHYRAKLAARPAGKGAGGAGACGGFSYGEAKAAVSEVLAQLEAEGCEL